MTVNIADYFAKASNGSGIPVATTLASQKASGASSLAVTAATNWPTATVINLALYTLEADGKTVTPGSVTIWKGILSGTTVGTLTLKGGTDTTYPAGSIVVLQPTHSWADDLITGLLQQHTQTGTHTAITTDTIASTGAASFGGAVQDLGILLSQYRIDTASNFVVSGCLWTPDSAGATLNGSMTSGVVWIAGKRLTVAAVTAHAFTASKDTYVDFKDNGDGTAALVYTPVNNSAASPALGSSGTTANTIRNAIIVSGGSSIAAQASINQGNPNATLPVVTYPLQACDSIGNLIYPDSPRPGLLGVRHNGSDTTSVTTNADIVSVTVLVPAFRKVRLIGEILSSSNPSSVQHNLRIYDASSAGGTQYADAIGKNRTAGDVTGLMRSIGYYQNATASAVSKTFYLNGSVSAGTGSFNGSSVGTFLEVAEV